MVHSRVGLVAAVLAGLLVGIASAEEAAKGGAVPLRSFDRFELDSGTVDGLWVEVGSAMTHNVEHDYASATKLSTSVTNIVGRLAYGSKHLEGGVVIPYTFLDSDLEVNGVCTPTCNDRDGIGDMRIYGKVIPVRTEYLDVGGGYELSIPTGDEDDGLGTGDAEHLWYFTAAAKLGSNQLQMHFGRQTTDSYIYGGGFFHPLNDRLVLRGEFVGATTEVRGGADPDIIFFEPGVDLRIPYKTFDLVVRPTGAIGVTGETPDWGIGGSIAVTWNPS